MNAKKRKANETNSPTAIYLKNLLDRHPSITQTEIADTLNIGSSTNIITIFKKGKSKFPIRYIIPLCEMLGEDPKEFLITAISEYNPELLDVIDILKGEIVNEDEIAIVRMWRKAKEAKREKEAKARLEKAKKEAIKDGVPLPRGAVAGASRFDLKLTDDAKHRNVLFKAFTDTIRIA